MLISAGRAINRAEAIHKLWCASMTSSTTSNQGTWHRKAFRWTCKQDRPSQGHEVRGNTGYSVHKVVKFGILWEVRRAKNKIIALDLIRADLQTIQKFGRIPWNMILDRREVKQSWLMFKGHPLQALERSWQIETQAICQEAWLDVLRAFNCTRT